MHFCDGGELVVHRVLEALELAPLHGRDALLNERVPAPLTDLLRQNVRPEGGAEVQAKRVPGLVEHRPEIDVAVAPQHGDEVGGVLALRDIEQLTVGPLPAHPPLEDDERDWLLRFPEMLSAALSDPLGSGAQPDPYLVDQIVGAATGIPMSIMPGAPDFVRIKNSAKLVNNLAVVPELEVETESLAFETGN